ncbi:hypothetical protein BFP76_07205 [Amylibacter kogurei]|uniref:Fungal lipase-like domain-containing protein n=1 Tax=Paramylibacter kogurei TaxID=1889778 RepID=A0A2G5K8B8_9RHOB|nr:hypothetical protein [Amylibacter kogurei]PIB24934.1 hypothetical protein BFP76_07205 [Amylibacter kogurei]
MTDPSAFVKKRKVFYVPGYDPMLPRRYRERYRSEGAAQAEISGYELAIKGRTGGRDNYGWSVHAQIDGHETDTEIDFLLWSDIVENQMKTSVFASFITLLKTHWIYIGSGAVWQLFRMPNMPMIAALYPSIALILQLIIAIFIVWGGVSILGWFGALIGVALAWAFLHWVKRYDNKTYVNYLLTDYAFASYKAGEYSPDMSARMADFSNTIHAAMTEDVDEVLIVGHSCGAHLSVTILADVLRQGLPDNAPKLAFLSLGQVTPMVSFLPNAWRLRRDLNFLSNRDDITWVDVTAPGDGACHALCDPVKVSGVAPDDARWPLVISASFSQSLKPETFKKLRYQFFRMHFQYLCAFDQPKDYDYFQITAGPLTLRDRYHGRNPSPSRIDKPYAKYRSMEPSA